MVNGIEYYEFQENCVDYLIDRTTDPIVGIGNICLIYVMQKGR